MKIKHVTIHNFRSIRDASFEMRDYGLVIGANNAGKSAVVDAIRCFYETNKESKFDSAKDFPKFHVDDGESWVEIVFYLTSEENESLKEEYQSSDYELRLRKYFLADSVKTGVLYFVDKNEAVTPTPFYGAKNAQDGKIGELIYIPAISKVEEQAKLTGPSAMRDLISKIMEGVVEDSEPYKKLSSQINDFASSVVDLKTEDQRSLGGFEKRFNECIEMWGVEFSLALKTPSSAEMVKNMVAWKLRDKMLNAEQSIERYGSGFQRHFIYSLIKLNAEFLPRRKTSKSEDFCPLMTLLLFEEPEAFLHPQQQDELYRQLKRVAKNGAWQVLCTSHSSQFLSNSMHDIVSVVRLQKEGSESKLYQISEATLNDDILSTAFDENLYPTLKEKYESHADPIMESVKFALWLNPSRAGMFFASKVLLVEGPTEQALIYRLRDDGLIELPVGSFVLDCFGKYNLFRFMKLLNALGIRHSVLHDKDKPNDKEHREWNLLTERTRQATTDLIEMVDPDIEGALGATRSEPHAKPQGLLLQYEKGSISQIKIDKFCTLIMKLMHQ